MHDGLDHGAQIVAIDLRVTANGVDAVLGRLLHAQHQLRKGIGAPGRQLKTNVVGRIPVAVVVEKAGLLAQSMLLRINRQALQRGDDPGVKGAVAAIFFGEVRRQCVAGFASLALPHNPSAQVAGIYELMQR
ncbi:hypothetical protein D3C73_583030 [compost metagenome]